MKEEVASSYVDRWRATTMNYHLKKNRKALVVGAEPGNIGGAICSALVMSSIDWKSYVKSQTFDASFPGDTFARESDADILILCNGRTQLGWIEDLGQVDAHQVVKDSLTGSIVSVSQFVKETIDKPYLKYIVFIGSMAYRNVLNASAAYCAAKAGLAHFTECLGYELAPKGYRVFCVHPSNVSDTPMTEETIKGLMRYRGLTESEAEAYWSSGLLLPDFLDAEDVASTVLHLISGEADFQTGSNIELRAGQR